MWMLILITLAVNGDDGVHSDVQPLRFPNETTCEKAAAMFEKLSLSVPGSNGKLVMTAKCVQSE
jgi:hypothetical protein